MKQYLELVQQVLTQGKRRTDRTGVGTFSIFGAQCRYDLREGFPLLTTKKVNFDAVKWELLWLLSGSTNVRDLHKPCKECWGRGFLYTPSWERAAGYADTVKCPKCNGTAIDPGSRIWDQWAKDDGSLGPVYGQQWRSWQDTRKDWKLAETAVRARRPIDQIQQVLDAIKTKPDSRRIIVSAWNVAEIDEMALPPCHTLFQFYVGFEPDMEVRPTDEWTYRAAREIRQGDTIVLDSTAYVVTDTEVIMGLQNLGLRGVDSGLRRQHHCMPDANFWSAPGKHKPAFLDCQLYQRSGDLALGVPFNIASYALLTHMIAQECNLTPRYFIHTFGDVHVYTNHVDGLKKQLERPTRALPQLELVQKPLFELGSDDIQLHNYDPHPYIKFEVAV